MSRDVKYLHLQDIKKLIEVADNDRDKLMVKVFFASFCRSNELKQLRVSDIRFNKSLIHFRSETTKTGRPKVAVIPTELIEEIKEFLNKNNREAKFNNTEFLFQSRQSKQMSNRRIRQIIVGLGIKAELNSIYQISKDGRNLNFISPHVLRHSSIVHALNCGIQETIVMQQSGHSSARGFSIYSQFSVEDRRKIFEDKGFYELE